MTRRLFTGALLASPGLLAQPSLPPAIANLKNRRAEARPITAAERDERIERARRLMTENKLEAICLTGGTSLRYFGGMRWGNSERLFAMVIPRRGQPFFVSPAFEEERAREQVGPSARVWTWQEDEDPYALIGKGLRDVDFRSGNVGIDERVVFAFSEGIAKSNPAFTFSSATPVTAGCRARKSPAELALMRLANSVTLEAYRGAWQSVREGMTNHEFAALIESAMDRQGFPGGVSVQVGEFSALPHGSAKPQPIREGTVVMMDDGCAVEGYQSDITRTVVLGKPTDKMRRVFDIVHNAQSAALAAAKPGEPCEAVDRAARKVIEDAGYGPGYKYFTHRLGHGIGMDGHEWPYLVGGNKLPLAPGMTFSDEPGIYIRGEFGVRLEDDMVITDKGAELFTPQAQSPEAI
ncbi:MAG TPA: Xaa-Pro peptidase family protein [Bryobacteraceae bacterium]|nr:Xaa-Pro peptidase family protein [Bryobacteraceae bacterium]